VTHRIRNVTFVGFLTVFLWAASVGAFDDPGTEPYEEESACGQNHYGYTVSNVSQQTAKNYCQTGIVCGDFCAATGCGSNVPNGSTAHPTGAGCPDGDAPSGWTYASLGKCDCTPLPE
jgi:hypothetical protein